MIYAALLGHLLAVPWGTAALTYGKSAFAALAAGAPLAAAQWFGWFGAEMGLIPLLGLVALGVLCWLAALPLVRHPFWGELQLGLAQVRLPRPARQEA